MTGRPDAAGPVSRAVDSSHAAERARAIAYIEGHTDSCEDEDLQALLVALRQADEKRVRLETALREERTKTVEAVMALMRSAGTFATEVDALIPHTNGYSTWFVGRDQIGTAGLTAEEIVRRIEAREALSGTSGEAGSQDTGEA